MLHQLEPQCHIIEGFKMKTIHMDEHGLKFMNKTIHVPEDFEKTFNKYKFFYNGRSIPYSKIRNISWNPINGQVTVYRKSYIGVISEEFVFISSNNVYHFLEKLEKACFFTRRTNQLTPWQATKSLWFWTGIVLLTIVVSYNTWFEMQSPEYKPSTYHKNMMFEAIVGKLGLGGLTGVTLAIISILIYQYHKKYKDPPLMTIMDNPSYSG